MKVPMQVVRATGKDHGSFDWELPRNLNAVFDSMQPQLSKEVLTELEKAVTLYLQMLVSTMCMGSHMPDALDIIKKNHRNMVKELGAIAVKPKG